MELFTYPSKNYSKVDLDMPLQTLDLASLKHRWVSFGLARSVHLVLLAHENSFPHVLLIKSMQNGKTSWRLPQGYVEAGATDIVMKLIRFLLISGGCQHCSCISASQI